MTIANKIYRLCYVVMLFLSYCAERGAQLEGRQGQLSNWTIPILESADKASKVGAEEACHTAFSR